jgi:multiple sugar transport system substrate-binding protein
MWKKRGLISLVILSVAALTACGNAGNQEQAGSEQVGISGTTATASQEPVNLKFYNTNLINSQEEFQQYFIDPAQKKYPNIHLTFVPTNNKLDEELDGMVTTGDIPDLIMASMGNGVYFLSDRNLTMDLSPLIKKFNYNLNQLDPSYLQLAKAVSDGKIYGLPIYAGGAPVYTTKICLTSSVSLLRRAR